MFYAIYFFQRYPTINTIRISYVYVEHTNYENDIVLERKHLTRYQNDLINLINDVEKDEEFNKKESKLCDYCEFQKYCIEDYK